MRSLIRVLVVTTLLVVFVAAPTFALEKSVRRFTDSEHNGWRGSADCSLAYYNTCTGWIWVWNQWAPNDRFGVAFDSCCPVGNQTSVGATFVYFASGAPAGYGFTGALDVYDADAQGCQTGSALASAPLLPAAGWNTHDFAGTVVPDDTFLIMFTAGPGAANPMAVGTDHPAVGPTGPQACGTCYPVNRTNHSFWWGPPTSAMCPGSPMNDGVCDAQFLWDVAVGCAVSTEQTTWGAMKNLYR